MKEICFAAGCFWGAEHFFRQVRGVASVEAGYANGHTAAPTYREVYTDTTGYAETVRVTYDPEQVDLRTLVEMFFTLIDPLSLNRQGGDAGTRYRTGVYYVSEADRPVLEAVFGAVQALLEQPLAVELQPLRRFFRAEEEHQAYLTKHPGGYCHVSPGTFRCLEAYQAAAGLLAGETSRIARMAEVAACLEEAFHYHWVGFYLVEGDMLVLGPFQGPVACLRIRYGKGVCGTAWAQGRTLIVPDVEAFPGHIACSALSRSEIVVPLFAADGTVSAVLDVDSRESDAFDHASALWITLFARLTGSQR